jgi:hypothetical protein
MRGRAGHRRRVSRRRGVPGILPAMSISLHDLSIDTFVSRLQTLAHLLARGAEKLDPAVMVGLRLAPDMHPLARQVQFVCNQALDASAWLTGRAPPTPETPEETLEQLQRRITATIAASGTSPPTPSSAARTAPSAGRSEIVHARDERPPVPPRLHAAQLLLPPRHDLRDPPRQRRLARQAPTTWATSWTRCGRRSDGPVARVHGAAPAGSRACGSPSRACRRWRPRAAASACPPRTAARTSVSAGAAPGATNSTRTPRASAAAAGAPPAAFACAASSSSSSWPRSAAVAASMSTDRLSELKRADAKDRR